MACVPPRAGFESARKIPIARGVPLSHCKMKQLLARSSMWHRTFRGWPPALTVRNMVSQAVVVEEIEAIEASEASEKKAVHRQRWQSHETMALIAAKKQQDLMGMDSTEAAGIETKKTKNKWKEVEAFCRERGVDRSAQQCQTRWSRLLSAFTQIRSWEETRRPEQPSFWSLKLDERKSMGFLGSLDQKTYNALNELFNTKADAIENVFDNNNVVEVAELGSVNYANEADVHFGYVQGKSDEIKNMTNSHSSSYKSELEECRYENHVDQCKAMENTKILSEFLQMAMDDRNDDQLPLVSTGKFDLKPTVLPTGKQVEELKVSGIADHSDPLILCDQEDVNVKAQLLPASAEMLDDSNKESYKVPLVDDHNKAQLLHASAGNMDFNPSNLHTGQHTEPLKYYGKGEHIISKSCDQRDAYDKTEFLPASVEMMDDSDRVSCKGSLKEHGADEKTIVMHGDDDSVSSSGVMHDEIAQAAQDKHIEEGADGILFKTNASVIDSLAEESIASVAASVEESCKCQKSESHLSSTGVDVLNANQSTQTTPLSHISADKEDCQNYFVGRILVEEAWVGKNSEGEGDKVNSFLSPRKVEEDISTALADSSQSNFIEAQNKNDSCQMFEQQEKQDPGLDFKEEIGTASLKQGPQDNSTFPISETIESTWGDQEKEFEKFELRRLPEEGHIEMIADVTERFATTLELECGAGRSFEEKKAELVQNGKNEFNKKTSEPSQSIKHFEVAVKDMDREACNEMQSDYQKEWNDAFERSKVATEEGDWVAGIGASTVDTNPPAHTGIDHQVQHVPEQKSTIKGDAGSLESASEASRVEVAANQPTKLEFIVKDDRGTPATAEKGSIKDGSQKTSAGSPADEDVFTNIPAATGSLVKSTLQTIRNFFKF